MDKSYVTMEQNLCEVCGTKFDTGSILLDRRLKNSFEQHTLTGWGLCPECKGRSETYIALVEADSVRSKVRNGRAQNDDVYRTGRVMWLKKEAFTHIFNSNFDGPLVFLEQAAFTKVEEMYARAVAKDGQAAAESAGSGGGDNGGSGEGVATSQAE